VLVISNLDKTILTVNECLLYTKFMVVHVLCTNSLNLLSRTSIQNVHNDVEFSYANRNDIRNRQTCSVTLSHNWRHGFFINLSKWDNLHSYRFEYSNQRLVAMDTVQLVDWNSLEEPPGHIHETRKCPVSPHTSAHSGTLTTCGGSHARVKT